MSDEKKTREAIYRLALRIRTQERKEGRAITLEDSKGKRAKLL